MKICLNCGQPLPPKRRKYCSEGCAEKYWQEHIAPLLWYNARRMALERTGGRCEKCGHSEKKSFIVWGIEVHHIIPLETGEPRWKSEKNRQENLMVLCQDCHEEVHHPKAATPQLAMVLDG